VLRVMLAHGVKKMVFSSSCATYGIPASLPITEATPQEPVNPYGLSKLVVERILKTYAETYGFGAVMLRYFNACGADPDGEIGELHDPETHLIPRALMAADQEGAQLEVFGTDYPTRDGTCERDYIHVTDLATAHVAALHYLLAGGAATALNLGTGVGSTIFEVIREVEKITGRTVPVHHRGRRVGDPPELVADGSLAATVLGVRPVFSDLRTIVQTAWDWHQQVRRGTS
jgi:UDP-arabinose 4-epimerase